MGSHNVLVTGATKLFNVDISHRAKFDNAPFDVPQENVFFVCASRLSTDAWVAQPIERRNYACMTRDKMDALIGRFWNRMPLFKAEHQRV